MNPIFFEREGKLYRWLEENPEATKLWVGIYKKSSGRATISLSDVLDIALCFGWTESIRKTIDQESYGVRLCPRKAGSGWSENRVKRFEELRELGMTQPRGEKAFSLRDPAKTLSSGKEARSHVLPAHFLQRFKEEERGWEFWEAQPPGYRKLAAYWIMSAKRVETRERRLSQLISDSCQGLRLKQFRKPAK